MKIFRCEAFTPSGYRFYSDNITHFPTLTPVTPTRLFYRMASQFARVTGHKLGYFRINGKQYGKI